MSTYTVIWEKVYKCQSKVQKKMFLVECSTECYNIYSIIKREYVQGTIIQLINVFLASVFTKKLGFTIKYVLLTNFDDTNT